MTQGTDAVDHQRHLSAARTYRPLVDVLRLVSAFGILMFHEPATPTLMSHAGHTGLFCFLLLLPILGLRYNRAQSVREHVNERAQRLMLPWFVWSAVYFAAMGLRSLQAHETLLPDIGSIEFWFAGPSLHLWFLPFAFVSLSLLIISGVPKLISRHTISFAAFSFATGLVMLALHAQYIGSVNSLPKPLPQWLLALPSIPLGVGLAILLKSPNPRSTKPLLWLGAVSCAMLVLALAFDGLASWYYLCAFVVTTLAYVVTSEKIPFLRKVCTPAFGVYLAGPLFAAAVHIALPDIHWLITVTLTFIGAYAASLLIAQTRFRFLVS
ncbi:MAG: hypothetical protein H6815_11250 [Phycisphaeraceae bacterium]|nr:hypothetical protein [Phycisphaerales bacterium]MCB9861013.1 hypothetical protein [Phycisphaeraceae bacterium]